MKKYSLILLISVLLWGCSHPSPFQFRGVSNLQMTQIPQQTMRTLSATLTFFNPNDFAIKLKKIDADVYINEQFLTHYHIDTLLTIQAKNDFSYNIVLPVNPNLLLNNALSALLNKGISFRVVGKSKVGRSLFYMNLPFDYSFKKSF